MAPSRALNVVITGDAKGLGVATRQADGHLDNLGKSGAKMGKLLAGGFIAAGAAAGGALVIGLKKSVDAAKEAETSQARLVTQLKASGVSYRAHASEIDKVIQKHSQLAGLDDEDLQDAFTNIIRVTGDVDKSMRLVGLAADFARAKHMDVAKAGELVGKVAGGNIGILSRYGIQVDKNATSAEALGLLQQKFAGQAEAYGKTAAGAQERFGVAIENLQEKIGAKLLPVLTDVTGKVADFVGGMESGEGAGGRFADGIGDAARFIQNAVTRVRAAVNAWVKDNRADIQSVVAAVKTFGGFVKEVFLDTALPIIKRLARTATENFGDLVRVIKGVVRIVSGLFSGDWDKAWSAAKDVVSAAFRIIKRTAITQVENIIEILKDLGPKAVKLIARGIINSHKAIAEGIVSGIKAAAKAVPGLAADALKGLGKAITSAITAGLGKINPFGDGLGVGDGIGKNMFPAFGGGLMGARPEMAPVAGIGARFGLGVSSGKRPGAITSSGNQSWHSSGEALDVSGPPAGMKGFFNYMKNTMGPRLAELIYTPGGAGIKNGSSYTYGGKVAADHFDHVHVAIDTGAPGIGDGIGRLRNGPKGPLAFNTVAAIAESVGLPGVTFAQLAQGESGLDPDNVGNDPGGTQGLGLWQITTGFNDDLIARYGGPRAMFDPRKNALAAKAIWDRQGKGAWYGTSFVKGWDLHYSGGSSGAGARGKGGKGSRGGTSRGSSGDVTPAFYERPEVGEEQQRASDFVNRTGPFAVKPKGGGPTKGFTPQEVERGIPEMIRDRMFPGDAPTELDYLDMALANAEATPGTDDDRPALQGVADYRFRDYQAAVASGDPRRIAQARRDLTSAENAIKSLEEAVRANTNELSGVRADLEKQRADDLQRQLNVSQSQYGTLAQAVWDAANQFGGSRVGLGMSGLRATAGSVSRA